MANLYGVANPLPLPVFAGTIGGVNIPCPAGVETNVIALVTNPPNSQGWYYPMTSTVLVISCGATPPTSVNYNARIGAGSDFATAATLSTFLTANANVMFSGMLIGVGVALAYPTGPLTINISVTPQAQAVNVYTGVSYAYGWWMRAPDQ